ncbi:hypothetical protein R3W88_019897 [Solanum pinnatisectum]|uniref:Cytochrome b561 domain-containing protein n=1 Tax=Solanum pinnatisectum TaxID=50273 RepID=A0AAV9KNG3_9SOLN|nr:hypothetical protein R3W88_019897 [Solanum pinnatisectum]
MFSFQIILHGFLLWASMGFLMPIGILVIRMTNRHEECGTRLKIIHATLQILSFLLVTTAAIISIGNFDNSFTNNHQRIGLAVYAAIWLQFSVHWLLGVTVSLLGIINIYAGLQSYHTRTMRSTSVWNLAFTVEIVVILFIYLLQEKWALYKANQE